MLLAEILALPYRGDVPNGVEHGIVVVGIVPIAVTRHCVDYNLKMQLIKNCSPGTPLPGADVYRNVR